MNMKRIISIVSVAAFIFPYVVPVFAQAEGQEQMEALKSDPKFYEVDPASIGVEYLGEVEEQNIDRSINEPVNSSAVEKEVASRGDTGQNALQITQMLNDIANIAKKAWKVVDDGRPVSNVHSLYATALPKGKRASQLQGWSKPRTHRYGFYVKNLYGIKTVEATYKVSYQYGGSLNGRGRYLTAVTVIPENVETMFGFNFNMSASVPDSTITNIGSSQNPVSALSLVLQWRISTILKDSQSTAMYYITGNGGFTQTANPFRSVPIRSSGAVPQVSVSVPSENIKAAKKEVVLPVKSISSQLRDPEKVF